MVAAELLSQESSSTKLLPLAAIAVAHGVVPVPVDAERLLESAKRAAAGAAAGDVSWLQVALWEYQAGLFDDAIRRLDIPTRRDQPWAKPVLAMAYHRLGNQEQAKVWLARAQAYSAEYYLTRAHQPRFYLRQRLANAGRRPVPDARGTRVIHRQITSRHDGVEQLQHARAYLKLGEPEMADREAQAALAAGKNDPYVWLASSRFHSDLGRLDETAADLARAKSIAEDALVKQPADTKAATTLAHIVQQVAQPPGDWQILRPSKVKSEEGAVLTILLDNSVLASGRKPAKDVYLVEAEFIGRIGAIRLEVIPDPSMVKGGSGRGPTGNFILSDFRAQTNEGAVAWDHALADFSQTANDHRVSYAIDNDESTGWAIYPREAESHWAIFVPVQTIGGDGPNKITLRLAFQNKDHSGETLGRFRFSVIGESGAAQHSSWSPARAATPHARLGAVCLMHNDRAGPPKFSPLATAANPKLPVIRLVGSRTGTCSPWRTGCSQWEACRQAAQMLKPNGREHRSHAPSPLDAPAGCGDRQRRVEGIDRCRGRSRSDQIDRSHSDEPQAGDCISNVRRMVCRTRAVARGSRRLVRSLQA